jgi:hypothetical protein
MDILGIAKVVGKLGLPLIEKALEGRLKGKSKYMAKYVLNRLAEELFSVHDTPLPKNSTLEQRTIEVSAQLYGVENQKDHYKDKLSIIEKELEVIMLLSANTNETMRKEMTAQSTLTRLWRPIFGITYSVCFGMFALSVCGLMVFNKVDTLNAIASMSGVLAMFFSTGAGVLGVYAYGRSKEKIGGVE